MLLIKRALIDLRALSLDGGSIKALLHTNSAAITTDMLLIKRALVDPSSSSNRALIKP